MNVLRAHPLLRRLLIALAIFVALLGALLTAALHSETVFRFALDAARPLIPGTLRYQSVDGTLAGPVRARDAEYVIADTRVRADTLAFDLSPWALLRGDIRFAYLRAEGLRVALPPSRDAEKPSAPLTPRRVFEVLSLPVRIRADVLDVVGFTLTDAAGAPLVALDRLHARVDWHGERLDVHALEARGPLIEVTGDARLGLGAGEATHLDIDGAWKGTLPMAGAVRATGDTRRLEADLELRRPATATLHAQLQDLLDAPHWQGRLDVASFRPADVAPDWPAAEWSGAFRFAGDRNDTRIRGSAQGGWPPATGVDLVIDARVNAERLRADTLDARVEGLGAAFDASGELHYADGLRYAASGQVARFVWPGLATLALRDGRFEARGDADGVHVTLDAGVGGNAQGRVAIDGELAFADLQANATMNGESIAFDFGDARLAVEGFSARLAGTPQHYEGELEAHAGVNALPSFRTRLSLAGDIAGLAVNIATLRWLDGNARGRVTVGWRDGVRGDVTLDGRGFDLARLDAGLNGRVGGRVDARVSLRGEQPDIAIAIASLTGDVGGASLEGSGSVRFADGRLTTQDLVVRAGDARLALEDGARGGFDFRLAVPALERFHPMLGGTLRAAGHVEGTLASPSLRLEASGSELRWHDRRVAALELRADIRSGAQGESTLQLEAHDLATPWLEAGRAELELVGTRDAHRIGLEVERAGRDRAGAFALAAEGGWQDAAWRGDFSALQLEHPVTGLWQLDTPSARKTLRLGGGDVHVPEHCLQGPAGRACIGPVSANAEGWSATASLRDLPVGIIAGWLPPGLGYAGTVSGDVRVQAGADGPRGHAAFRLSPGGIRQVSGDGTETLLGWDAGEARLRFDGSAAQADLDIALPDGGRIIGQGRVERPGSKDATLDARLQAAVNRLQLVPSLVPALSDLRGRLTADLRVSGALAAPRVRGVARLQDASARLLALGTDWRNIDLELRAEGREIAMTGRAESGKGHVALTLEGRDAGDGFAGQAKLSGENFRAIATPEARVDISPRLNLALRGSDLYVDGEVHVPFARIEPRDLSAAVRASDDQVIVNADETAESEGLQVHVAVTTRLGDDVRIDAFGLEARMGGTLTVAQQPGNPAVGNGRLMIVEGEYTAYGQDLTLARGELIYTGQPLSNPGLDIRAERHPEEGVTVGVAVRGPLAQPVTSVYSDPAMPETAALAYLLFGRPIEQATGEEEGQISEAAIALGLGGQRLLGNVGRRLGVEEVRVEDVGDRERASLVLGKYLSPDLYVSYGIGLFEAVNTFRLRYRLSSRWVLEATSGLDSSADFLYTIER